jgi:hypothetical protein
MGNQSLNSAKKKKNPLTQQFSKFKIPMLYTNGKPKQVPIKKKI